MDPEDGEDKNPKTNFRRLTKSELCVALGVETKAVTRWHNEGLPYIPAKDTGESNIYDLPVVIRWWIKRETKGGMDVNEERAKLAKEQTETARLRNVERRGEMIPLSAVVEIAQRAAHAIRQKIVSCSMSEDEKNVLLTDINSLANADYTNFKRLDEADDEPDEEAAPAAS